MRSAASQLKDWRDIDKMKYRNFLISILITTLLLSGISILAQEKKNQKLTGYKEVTMESEIKNESISIKAAGEKQSSDMVLIQTEKGSIKIKLFTKEAPITTDNFIDLIKKGFYNSTVFHRVVENFVIQGGDPLGDGTGNYIDQGTGKARLIKLETNPALKFDKPGRVGMARTANPNSASCQFFIALQPLPSLDPGGVDPYGYAVFGQVTDDSLETIKKIVKDFKPSFPGSDRPANPVRIHSISLQ